VTSVDGPRRRPPRRNVRRGRLLAALVAGVLLFLLGIAVGQVIEESGGSGGSVTYERTITVRPVPETVTVTSP
jgi:amino acid transporter